jgi:hypothetical protein
MLTTSSQTTRSSSATRSALRPSSSRLTSRPANLVRVSVLHVDVVLTSILLTCVAVIDADPYIPNGYGAEYWVNQVRWYRGRS